MNGCRMQRSCCNAIETCSSIWIGEVSEWRLGRTRFIRLIRSWSWLAQSQEESYLGLRFVVPYRTSHGRRTTTSHAYTSRACLCLMIMSESSVQDFERRRVKRQLHGINPEHWEKEDYTTHRNHDGVLQDCRIRRWRTHCRCNNTGHSGGGKRRIIQRV